MSSMGRVRAILLGLGVMAAAWPGAAAGGYDDSPKARRESRLATYMVRRYCRPEYLIKTIKSSGNTSQRTWSAIQQSDGKYRVSVDDFSWDVDVATRAVQPGATVQAAVAAKRLPEICLCVEGTPPPPPGWEPAPAQAPAGASPASAGLPDWLIGSWRGKLNGATILIRFSADGTWRRERTEPGAASPSLIVEGTATPAGSAIRLTVTAVNATPGAKSGERAPKIGSTTDASCVRVKNGGLTMTTSGTALNAKRAGD